MSTKTLRKRIALVAVTALGAGVLVTSPVSAANNASTGGANVLAADGILNVATLASTIGDAAVDATDVTAGNTVNKSRGLLANSTTLTTSSLSSTATMRADGEIAFYYQASAASTAVTVVVDGGTITDSSISSGGTAVKNINAGRTQLVVGPNDASKAVVAFAFTPSSGATSGSVSVYQSAALAADGSATEIAAIQAGSTAVGTLKQRYTVTVASTSAANVYASTYSYIKGTLTPAEDAASNVDETDSLTINSQTDARAYININLRDAYNASLSGYGALIISATNGAYLKYSASGTASSSGWLLSDVSTDPNGTLTVARPLAFANKAFTTTVTFSWNGAVVGTKSVKFLGEVATLTLANLYVARVGDTSTVAGTLSYADNAGNALYPATGSSVVSTTLNTSVTNVVVGTAPDSSDDSPAYLDVTCGGTAGVLGDADGKAAIQFQHVNSASGTIVKSNVVDFACAGDPATYTASFDKASYAPGDIATLTVAFKDNKGNAANAYSTFSATEASGNKFAITTPANLTIVTAISETAKATSGPGIKTYKYIVGTTEGSFQVVVSSAIVNNKLYGGANQTVPYKVASTSTAVTNADVLKAIVSLIASINKQIAALQKALLKK